MVTLEPITQQNFKAVIAMELEESQKSYVQTNEYSIAQSYIYPEFRPMAICKDGTPVGFLLWCIDTDEDAYWIYRLMLHKTEQHKGYGTAQHIAALKELGPCPAHRRSFIGKFV